MLGEAAALAASATWAVGSHLFSRIGKVKGATPTAMNLGKCATGTLCFALASLLLLHRVVPALTREQYVALLASGFVGLALGDGCYFGALVTLGVRRAILLLSTAPVWTAIGGAIFLDEKLSVKDSVAILAVMLGVAIVVYEQAPVTEGDTKKSVSVSTTVKGVLFGVGAGLGQAGGSLLSRRAMVEGVSALDAALVRLPGGFVGIAIMALLAGKLPTYVRTLSRPRLMAAIAGSAFVGTFCGIWLAQYAIGHATSTAVATTLLATSPVFALPLGRWLDHERIGPRALFGTALAVAGLTVLTLRT